MNIEITHDNGKHFLTVHLSNRKKRNLKLFLVNLFEQEEKTNKDFMLYFAGGGWYIPKDKINEMYKKIIYAYSDITHETNGCVEK